MTIRIRSDVILGLDVGRSGEPRLLYHSDLAAHVDPRQPLRKILLCARCWVRMSESPRELIHSCPRCRFVVSDHQLASSRDPTLDGRVRWVHCNDRLADELRTRPLYRPTPSEVDVQTVYWPTCVCGAMFRLDGRRQRVECRNRGHEVSIRVQTVRAALRRGASLSWLDRDPELERLRGFRLFNVEDLVRTHAVREGGPWIRSDFEIFGRVDGRGMNRPEHHLGSDAELDAALNNAFTHDELDQAPARSRPGGAEAFRGPGLPTGPPLAPRLELSPTRPLDASGASGTSPPTTRDQRLEHLFEQIDDVIGSRGHDLEDLDPEDADP